MAFTGAALLLLIVRELTGGVYGHQAAYPAAAFTPPSTSRPDGPGFGSGQSGSRSRSSSVEVAAGSPSTWLAAGLALRRCGPGWQRCCGTEDRGPEWCGWSRAPHRRRRRSRCNPRRPPPVWPGFDGAETESRSNGAAPRAEHGRTNEPHLRDEILQLPQALVRRQSLGLSSGGGPDAPCSSRPWA